SMTHPPRLIEVPLAHRALHTLSRDTEEVTCVSGSLWITQDTDPQDIVLEPGQRFHPQPGRRAILYALRASVASLRQRTLPAVVRHSPLRSPAARGLVME
ncbi:MAG: DUF2917 domain-containing protein, partial [Burkholderiaceae bacterium]